MLASSSPGFQAGANLSQLHGRELVDGPWIRTWEPRGDGSYNPAALTACITIQSGELASVVHRDLLIDLDFGQRKRPAWMSRRAFHETGGADQVLDLGASIRHARTARPEIPDDLNLAHILVEELAHDGKPNRCVAKGQDKILTTMEKVWGCTGRKESNPRLPGVSRVLCLPARGVYWRGLASPRSPLSYSRSGCLGWARGGRLCAPPSMETGLGPCPAAPGSAQANLVGTILGALRPRAAHLPSSDGARRRQSLDCDVRSAPLSGRGAGETPQ